MPASGDPNLKAQLKSSFNDLSVEGFATSKVIALIDVLLQEGDNNSGSVTSHTFPSRKKLVKMIKTCYQFVIKNKAGKEAMWFVDMKRKGRVAKGRAPFKPDVTISCSDEDLVALATGEMNPQKLYAANRIKVRGNLDKALKVQQIISHEREKILLAGQFHYPNQSPERVLANYDVLAAINPCRKIELDPLWTWVGKHTPRYVYM